MRYKAAFVEIMAATLLLSAASNAAVYTYSDTTFNNADWSGVKYVDTSPGAVSVFAAFQQSPGGSAVLPGPQTPDYRLIRHVYGTGGSAIVVTHQGLNFNWAPLPLEVATTVDYSYDLNFFDGPAGAVGFRPAIFQGGNVYVNSTIDNIVGPQSGWVRFTASGIPITSFNQLDPSTGLTFPATFPVATNGMSFGFISANSASGLATKISGIDDYRFTLNTIVVPEPAALAGLTLGSVLARRRRPIA